MTRTMDLADLVAVLVSLTAPSTEIDRIVHVMLAGKRVRPLVSALDVRLGNWIDDEVPAYTAGGTALSVLAYRRGATLSVARHGCGFRALAGGQIASGMTEAGAACAAIAAAASLSLSRETPRDGARAAEGSESALAVVESLGNL